jgi:NAD(P)-dependent dehydrogenase (short-subunit alcohol dehydrogenase family)
MRKRAIVTGASRGIGRAIAERLVADRWSVLNLDVRKPVGAETSGVTWVETDLADPDALQATLSSLVAAHPITGLVNNAAIATPALLADVRLADFDATMAVNLRAPILCAQAVVQGMREAGFGRIVNLSSRAHLGKTERSIYAASKGGILSLSKVWALELAGDGITCNCIAPGPIRTEMFAKANPPDMPRTRAIIDSIPVRRLGEPEDVANAVAFFMDARSGFVTGQVLYVCGGITLARSGS